MAHRLDQAEDLVRLEIESAMAKGMPVIPVLVENANMPSVGELPDRRTGGGPIARPAAPGSDQRTGWCYETRLTQARYPVPDRAKPS